MNKHVTAVIAESGAYHDLQIAPGTTTRDICAQLGLGDHYLISKRGAEPFGDDENIYGAITDGEKLFLSTPVEVGSISDLFRFSSEDEIQTPPKWLSPRPTIVASPRAISPAESAPRFPSMGKPILVSRDTRSYWEQRGWTRSGFKYEGYYRTPFGSWKGKAEVSFSGRVELFIHKPPEALENHSHWACFRGQWGGWYFIHTNEPIADLSSGILAVEKILLEAHSHELKRHY